MTDSSLSRAQQPCNHKLHQPCVGPAAAIVLDEQPCCACRPSSRAPDPRVEIEHVRDLTGNTRYIWSAPVAALRCSARVSGVDACCSCVCGGRGVSVCVCVYMF
jgi:hypothetical protein